MSAHVCITKGREPGPVLQLSGALRQNTVADGANTTIATTEPHQVFLVFAITDIKIAERASGDVAAIGATEGIPMVAGTREAFASSGVGKVLRVESL